MTFANLVLATAVVIAASILAGLLFLGKWQSIGYPKSEIILLDVVALLAPITPAAIANYLYHKGRIVR